MGRRRKFVELQQTITVNEDKASNASSATESNGMESKKVKNEKNSRVESLVVRRSDRIKSLASQSDSHKTEVVPDHINLDEDEDEQERETVPLEESARSLEDKAPGRQEISYKSLYMDSQKKIEGLMEENYELVRKLEFARGKIAAHEVMKNVAEAVWSPSKSYKKQQR